MKMIELRDMLEKYDPQTEVMFFSDEAMQWLPFVDIIEGPDETWDEAVLEGGQVGLMCLDMGLEEFEPLAIAPAKPLVINPKQAKNALEAGIKADIEKQNKLRKALGE